MKNSLITTFICVFSSLLCFGQQKEQFTLFLKGKQKVDKIDFNTEKAVLKILNQDSFKTSMYDNQLISDLYSKAGYFSINHLISEKQTNVRFYTQFDENTYVVYDELFMPDGEKIYRTWVKSFNSNGNVVDSLLLTELSNFEEIIVRQFSEINSNKIAISFSKKILQEDKSPVTKKLTINYAIKNGKFVCIQSESNPIYKNDFGYKSLLDIIEDNLGACYLVDSLFYGDANNDNLIDVLIKLKSVKGKCNWVNYDLDIMISFSNSKNEFIFSLPPLGLCLKNTEHKLRAFTAKKGTVSYEIVELKSKKKLSYDFVFDKNRKYWWLTKVQNKANEEIKYFNDPKQVIQKSPKIFELFQ